MPVFKHMKQHSYYHAAMALLFCEVISIIVALGLRPVTFGTDTVYYVRLFDSILSHPLSVDHHNEYIFRFIINGLGLICSSPIILFIFMISLNLFVLFLSAIIIVSFYESSNNLQIKESPIDQDRVAIHKLKFFILLTKTISQTIEVSISAMKDLIFKKEYSASQGQNSFQWTTIIGLLVSASLAMGFHTTAILFLLPAVLLFLDHRQVLYIVVGTAVLYVLGVTPWIFKQLSVYFHVPIYDKVMSYGALFSYVRGIKYKFVAFTLVAGLIFEFIGRYASLSCRKEQFLKLVKIYWILTLPFFILGYGSFSDRYLLPAWSYLSILAGMFLKELDEYLHLSILFWMSILYSLVIGLIYYVFYFLS